MNKTCASILPIILLASILLVIESVSAQTIPKPSVPEFTLKYVERSFTTVDGVYYDSKTIEVTIPNQPSLNHSLFYNVKYRINNGNWKDIYTMDDAYPPQSDSDCTIILVHLHPQGNNTLVPTNSIVDVQVEAMIGYIHRGYNPNHTSQLDMYPYVFTGETSGWSNTQTITLSDNSVSSTPNVPEFPFILIVSLLLVGLATALMVKLETNTTINISLKRQI